MGPLGATSSAGTPRRRGASTGRLVESRVPGGRFEVTREPVGICAAFTAWNFPAALVARKVAPALAAGCSVIVRPSTQTPGVAMVMVDCCRAGDLPAGARATPRRPDRGDLRAADGATSGCARCR